MSRSSLRALFPAAFIAPRHDPDLKVFRERQQEAGTPPKIAFIAAAAKMVPILDAMLKNGRKHSFPA